MAIHIQIPLPCVFGWNSKLPIQRIKEALSEIKSPTRKDPILAADGAVKLLAILSPALEQVDSSSGAIQNLPQSQSMSHFD